MSATMDEVIAYLEEMSKGHKIIWDINCWAFGDRGGMYYEAKFIIGLARYDSRYSNAPSLHVDAKSFRNPVTALTTAIDACFDFHGNDCLTNLLRKIPGNTPIDKWAYYHLIVGNNNDGSHSFQASLIGLTKNFHGEDRASAIEARNSLLFNTTKGE